MESIIAINNLSKIYATGFNALKNINLTIDKGEIFALLGPNGAGKTTLISVICGIVNKTSGQVLVDGHDNVTAFRQARARIGLVPQELNLSIFESVWDTISFSRSLFGKPTNPQVLEKILKQLSLFDKKDAKIMTLSGGMKRRVLIAKALAHEPEILFLDEPTAGVDVELRKDMWRVVQDLRSSGVTVILTTHYIEEAEELADRVGVINKGEMVLIENKTELMQKMGKKQLSLHLTKPLTKIPKALAAYGLTLNADGSDMTFNYDTRDKKISIPKLLQDLTKAKVAFGDLQTKQSSLEDIFMGLVKS